jgi:hypothetical protein
MSENTAPVSVMQIQINVNFIEIKHGAEKDVEEFPTYSVPKTTIPQLVEIIFDEYKVPKTTGGFL